MTEEGLTFDHRLRSGRATSRNAIVLLRLNGAPPALVERAERNVGRRSTPQSVKPAARDVYLPGEESARLGSQKR